MSSFNLLKPIQKKEEPQITKIKQSNLNEDCADDYVSLESEENDFELDQQPNAIS